MQIEIQNNEEDQVVTPEVVVEGEVIEGEVVETEDENAEIVISLGDEVVTPRQEEDKTPAPEWVKDLRKRTKEQERIIREQQAQLDALRIPDQKAALGKKPSMSDDGIDYDEDAFAAAMEKWYDDKRKFDAAEAEKKAEAEKADQEWGEKLQGYQDQRAKLTKIEDFEEAEAAVLSKLSQVQQGIIVDSTDMPAHIIYALGKNPEKLKELSAITNPVRFTAALIRLESKMTVSKNKPATAPEKVVSGNSAVSGINDKTLDRLREEAQKTGDYTKVLDYRKQLKQKSK